MSLGAPRVFTLVSGHTTQRRNGQFAVYTGLGDGSDGGRPSTSSGLSFPVKLLRLYAKLEVTALSTGVTDFRVTVFNGGITVNTHNVFTHNFDMSSTDVTGWFQADVTTPEAASPIITTAAADFVIVRCEFIGVQSGTIKDLSVLVEAERLSS